MKGDHTEMIETINEDDYCNIDNDMVRLSDAHQKQQDKLHSDVIIRKGFNMIRPTTAISN